MAAADDRCRSDAARLKRKEQLSRWRASEEGAPGAPAAGGPRAKLSGTRVRFAQGAVFMAACSAGDQAEVRDLLAAGAPINGTNVDGLTALHQACIDENVDMVHFLVENGAYVNQPDNEGWTPLHAAASCGFVEIAQYLLKNGANIAAVNSEGELPLDVAHENAMEKLLKSEIKNLGIDLETARKEEEKQMLRDASQWVNKGKVEDVRHPKTGATALHVAAAKGYMEVMKLLLQVGYDVDVTDADGWTPIHAAAHWGQQEACRLLVEELCNMEALNTVGQTPLDVADDTLVSLLEELKKKQSELQLVKEKKKPPGLLIESSTSPPNPAGRARRSSISRMSSKEKISLHDKERRTEPATLERVNDEEESAKKESSSSSSEEEEASESESDAESEKVKNRERVNNLNNKLSNLSLKSSTSSTTTTNTTTSVASRKSAATPKEEEKGPPPPAGSGAPSTGWRTNLPKTGSYSALSTATAQPEEPKSKDAGLPKSASSPRLASELSDARGKEATQPRLARVNPTPTQRLFGNQESIPETTNRGSYTRQRSENADSTVGLNRTASQARKFGESVGGKKEPSQPQPTDSSSAYSRSSSFGRRTEDSTSTSTPSTVPATQTTTTGTYVSRLGGRVPNADDTKPKEPESTAVTNTETKERRRSYLTPVRDEEAEAQRKARSRHARQSRRSTQGVTLTDLKEAEKTIKAQQEGKNEDAKAAETEVQEKADESKDNQPESKTGRVTEDVPSASEVRMRSRIASLQKSDLLGLTQPSDPPRISASAGLSNVNRRGITQLPASKELEKSKEEEKDLDDKGSSNKLGVRDRRRPRGKRRSTGVPLTARDGEGDDDDDDVSEEEVINEGSEGKQVDGLSSRSSMVSNDHLSNRGTRNPATPSSIAALLGPREPEKKDFKKLYEDLVKDNGRIRLQLQEMQSLVTQTKTELERVNQRQERTVDRSVLLDTEKREKALLERRISDMQEELKMLADLKADNQRLKDENGALIRVISKLSK